MNIITTQLEPDEVDCLCPYCDQPLFSHEPTAIATDVTGTCLFLAHQICLEDA